MNGINIELDKPRLMQGRGISMLQKPISFSGLMVEVITFRVVI